WKNEKSLRPLVDRLTQPRDIQFFEHRRLPIQGDQFIGEVPVLHTVSDEYVADIEAFAQLPVHPEFVAVTPQAGWIAIFIEVQQISAHALRDGVFRNFVERPLREPLLPGKDTFHPSQGREPWTLGGAAAEVERHGEWAQVLSATTRLFVYRLPA